VFSDALIRRPRSRVKVAVHEKLAEAQERKRDMAADMRASKVATRYPSRSAQSPRPDPLLVARSRRMTCTSRWRLPPTAFCVFPWTLWAERWKPAIVCLCAFSAGYRVG
jgi:hypothetical protein